MVTKLEELREAYHLSSKEYDQLKYVEPDVEWRAHLAFAASNKARAAYHKELERLDD
jgi:hypothetical protein